MGKFKKYAVLSFSGGLDSTSLLLNLVYNKFSIKCLTFNYGQKHSIELKKSSAVIAYIKAVCKNVSIKHRIIDISEVFDAKGSSLLNNKSPVPKGHYEDSNMISTFVPNRNAIFTSIAFSKALSWSKKLKDKKVFISLGCHAGDHTIYPDCRPDFYNTLIDALKKGNWGGDLISTYIPYISFSKADILKDTLPLIDSLNLDWKKIYKTTNTSYQPCSDGSSPGDTSSDIERILAFHENGLKDPIDYKDGWTAALENAIKIEQDYKKRVK